MFRRELSFQKAYLSMNGHANLERLCVIHHSYHLNILRSA
uniref:Uncharacterized protein n=1 Tax=Heterorhabditis bacteriophora TaxID=37862 RepID=A0A1I7X3N7_HETBA